jgi:hypothetical protein
MLNIIFSYIKFNCAESPPPPLLLLPSDFCFHIIWKILRTRVGTRYQGKKFIFLLHKVPKGWMLSSLLLNTKHIKAFKVQHFIQSNRLYYPWIDMKGDFTSSRYFQLSGSSRISIFFFFRLNNFTDPFELVTCKVKNVKPTYPMYLLT